MATHSSVLALEKPRDGGTWWVAIYGVAQSRTRLKRLSSSSSSSQGGECREKVAEVLAETWASGPNDSTPI